MNANRLEGASANELTAQVQKRPRNWAVPSAILQEGSFKNSPIRLL